MILKKNVNEIQIANVQFRRNKAHIKSCRRVARSGLKSSTEVHTYVVQIPIDGTKQEKIWPKHNFYLYLH